MDIVSTIINAAKAAKVSGVLLLAICQHESNNFSMNYSADDKGSPSYGVCQVKLKTGRMLGFHGNPSDLINPKTNAKYAAQYLSYLQSRYGEHDWLLLVAAYNSGSYHPSNRVRGCPKNLKYIRKVRQRLPEGFRNRLDCGRNN